MTTEEQIARLRLSAKELRELHGMLGRFATPGLLVVADRCEADANELQRECEEAAEWEHQADMERAQRERRRQHDAEEVRHAIWEDAGCL